MLFLDTGRCFMTQHKSTSTDDSSVFASALDPDHSPILRSSSWGDWNIKSGFPWQCPIHKLQTWPNCINSFSFLGSNGFQNVPGYVRGTVQWVEHGPDYGSSNSVKSSLISSVTWRKSDVFLSFSWCCAIKASKSALVNWNLSSSFTSVATPVHSLAVSKS